ncbi:DUF411 domain-containing protein [Litoribrevibacter euphylliae]|uniref:DUF411 domain-containing protein n=1 Tax=Litoribrevibacter euphylliae TaxID=1834034 RepID=A0ABV7HDR2_9GAMM
MKNRYLVKVRGLAVVIAGVFLVATMAACSNSNNANDEPSVSSLAAPQSSNLDLNVYKSPTCGCCGAWVDHVQAGGLNVKSHNVDNLTQMKAEKGLKSEYRSCHTAVSREGYIFEGHVPVEYVQQFLKEQPEGALGLSVPGMPVGSPGMEMGDRIDTYQVLKINLDGSAEVYATVQGNH